MLLPLEMDRRNLSINVDYLLFKKEELEQFIKDEDKLNTKEFVDSILLINEVQSNNLVEGYYDDVLKIKSVVKNKNNNDKIIMNLYNGYKKIYKSEEINKDSLKELYKILSYGLLKEEEIKTMGNYYRKDDVYIYFSSDMSKAPDRGVDVNKIEYKMDMLFDFIDNFSFGDSLTDKYLKSQIIHFYFVYIHPYYDINGRTSRTLSMWNLINEKAYPYIIFNRGIGINKNEYYKNIISSKRYNDVTLFLNFMMDTVLLELKKEHELQFIKENCSDLTILDFQTLHYLLSMNGNFTVNDFANIYNLHNSKKRPSKIEEEMIKPLIEKEILIKKRDTNNHIANGKNNYFVSINPKFVDKDKNLDGISLLKK